ncbi:MAG: ribonuclease P protein component 1 [Candidatus Thorarchaeota archaeon]
MITPKELVRHELIGLEARVLESSNPSQVGLSGRVVDETRQTLSLETKKGVKSFAKDQCVFSFRLPSGESVKVEGKLLVSRPEDRIKKKLKSW